jgi:hypothetical protein
VPDRKVQVSFLLLSGIMVILLLLSVLFIPALYPHERVTAFSLSSSTIVQILQKYACNETKLMHYLSSVYPVTIPAHVLGLLVAHYQEVTRYICNS